MNKDGHGMEGGGGRRKVSDFPWMFSRVTMKVEMLVDLYVINFSHTH